MNEPLDPLPDELSDLLDAERMRPDEDAIDRAGTRDRVRSRLGATLGPLALGGGPGPTVPPPAAAIDPAAATAAGAGLASLLGKPAALGLLALGILGGAGAYALRAPDASIPAPTSHAAEMQERPSPISKRDEAPTPPDPEVEPTPPVAETPPPVNSPAPIASDARPAGSAAPSPPERDTDLAAERLLLEGARQAVARGDSAAAIAALQQHAREFPRGRLSEEREVLWIRALVVAGRRSEAIERASRYKKAHPRSLLLPSLEQSLGPIP